MFAAFPLQTCLNGDLIEAQQAGNLYRDVMTFEAREHQVGNIVAHLSGAQKRIQLRQTALFFKAALVYGSWMAKGLGLDIKEVERLAKMTQEECAKATECEITPGEVPVSPPA